jgi:hypothetical protein
VTALEVERLALELLADTVDSGLWSYVSPNTRKMIVQAIVSDLQKNPELLADYKRRELDD